MDEGEMKLKKEWWREVKFVEGSKGKGKILSENGVKMRKNEGEIKV